jgi:hypothetical protein
VAQWWVGPIVEVLEDNAARYNLINKDVWHVATLPHVAASLSAGMNVTDDGGE